MKRPLSLLPRSFLYFLPLYIGAELVTFFGIINNGSGLYGILSIFTGHPLSAVQWILNLLSLLRVFIYIKGFMAIQSKDALTFLVYAYCYCFDTLTNVLFVIYFGIGWFSTVNGGSSEATTGAQPVPTASTTADLGATGAIVAPAVTETADSGDLAASITEVASAAVNNLKARDMARESASPGEETAVTILITLFLVLVRIYFTLVIVSFARQLIRERNLRPHNADPSRYSFMAKVQYYLLSFGFIGRWTSYTSASAGGAPGSPGSEASSSSLMSPVDKED